MLRVLISLVMLTMAMKASEASLQEDIANRLQSNGPERALSRRKRYLVFPEGSSLQLVYCLTIPIVGRLGRLFTVGGTAALAWELPHEKLDPFKKGVEQSKENAMKRIDSSGDESSGGWTLGNGRLPEAVDWSRTYYDPFLINGPPTQYRPSAGIGRSTRVNGNGYSTINQDSSSSYVPPEYYTIHRRTRRDLYTKIEKFLSALNKDGKSCLLKAICEATQTPSGKGSFMEEIIKVVFRAKPHDEFQDEDDYDLAVNKNHNCTEEYPNCDLSIWEQSS